ncbi:hypothetical protein AJ80_09834 [Polytolypa hystricis UAMH7299]|uniref:DUF7924 domain-containing protein n=1 Tax=Polytolypa hystricis (strain UAMH7299) TaxID=1447883 RepID=A0A2B7WIM5_POLH7|nr:hypothetical protein AJ80_09834 [Polytolypa hystricis UAMH7299]
MSALVSSTTDTLNARSMLTYTTRAQQGIAFDGGTSSQHYTTNNRIEEWLKDDLPPPSTLPESSINAEKSSIMASSSHLQGRLAHYSVDIYQKEPPQPLIEESKRLLSQEQDSSAPIDADRISKLPRALWNSTEADLITNLFQPIIPSTAADKMIATVQNKPWANAASLPPATRLPPHNAPLLKPTPDQVFGYSKVAFSKEQISATTYLVDKTGSYSSPNGVTFFPFLGLEFKSVGTGGNHYVGIDKLDLDKPRYFSITMDQQLARINVHWLDREDGTPSFTFNTEVVSIHLLSDLNGVREVHRAILNILDHTTNVLLPEIRQLLDEYEAEMLAQAGREGSTETDGQEGAEQEDPAPVPP